jgi:hypothetical protein
VNAEIAEPKNVGPTRKPEMVEVHVQVTAKNHEDSHPPEPIHETEVFFALRHGQL